jgi:hypothetical protein
MQHPFLLNYSGKPPSSGTLLAHLGLTHPVQGRVQTPHTYLVATLALEVRRGREGFGGDQQIKQNLRAGNSTKEPQLLFSKALRHSIDVPVLTRAEEVVILRRAFDSISKNEKSRQLLRHDVFAWRDVLQELDEQGIDIRHKIPSDLASELVSPSLGIQMQELQREFRNQQAATGQTVPTFEDAARQFLKNDFRTTELVILEGFTFLTPMQEYFIEQCLAQGAKIYLIYPYADVQRYGFKIMGRTYGTWLDVVTPLSTPSEQWSQSALTHLKESLFSADTSSKHQIDDSVTLESYPHRNHEVKKCVERLQHYIGEGEYKPHEIAIVARDPESYKDLLREEAELQGWDDAFDITPRQLLLTPLGRFVLSLYDVWKFGVLQKRRDCQPQVLTKIPYGFGERPSKALSSFVKTCSIRPENQSASILKICSMN